MSRFIHAALLVVVGRGARGADVVCGAFHFVAYAFSGCLLARTHHVRRVFQKVASLLDCLRTAVSSTRIVMVPGVCPTSSRCSQVTIIGGWELRLPRDFLHSCATT